MEGIRLIALFKNAIKVKIKICTPVYSDNYRIFCFSVIIFVIIPIILIESCSKTLMDETFIPFPTMQQSPDLLNKLNQLRELRVLRVQV